MESMGIEPALEPGRVSTRVLVRVVATALGVALVVLLMIILGGAARASEEQEQGGTETQEERGLLVESVAPDGPAAAAGLRRGDILLTVDGTAMESFKQLWETVGGHEPGQTISLGVLHGDEQRTLSVVLGERDGKAFMGAQICMENHGLADVKVFAMPAKPFSGTLEFKKGTLPFDGSLDEHSVEGSSTLALPPEGVESGILVGKVVPGGPADLAGITSGTVITAVDGEPIVPEASQSEGPTNKPDDRLREALAARQPGDTLSLTVHQPGQQDEQSVQLTLGEDPNEAGKAYAGIEHYGIVIKHELAAGGEGAIMPEELHCFKDQDAEQEQNWQVQNCADVLTEKLEPCVGVFEHHSTGLPGMLKRAPLPFPDHEPGAINQLKQLAPAPEKGSI